MVRRGNRLAVIGTAFSAPTAPAAIECGNFCPPRSHRDTEKAKDTRLRWSSAESSRSSATPGVRPQRLGRARREHSREGSNSRMTREARDSGELLWGRLQPTADF